jgi:hypothetical protein
MGKTVEVTCDGCGHDLTTRSNIVDYRLVLTYESKPGHGPGAYTDMALAPPVDREYYFCDLQCLDHWRDRKHHKSRLWKAWWDKWKEENGTKDADGRIRSYPTPPQTMTEAYEIEFKTAALAAFPMRKVRDARSPGP